MSNNELSTGKAILGAILCPIMAIAFSVSPHGVSLNACNGIFFLGTIGFWVVAYLRIAEFVRDMSGSLPKRSPQPMQQQTTPLPPAAPPADSRSIFLD